MLFRNIRGFRIQHDERLGLLRVDWAGGRQLAYLRPALLQVQLLARQLHVSHLLLALDALPDLPVYDQIWLGQQWLPEVLKLPLRQVVLVLGSERVYNLHAIETLLLTFRLYMKCDLQFFTQLLPGLQWLTSHSPHVPELLAEWQAGFGGAATDAVVAPPTAQLR